MPSGPTRSPKRRNWSWRLSNPSSEECDYLHMVEPPNQEQDHPLAINNIKFLVYQLEECPKTGTPHLQGYVMFHQAITRATAKERLGTKRVNMRISNGNAESNIVYCTKDETRLEGPWEYGTRPAQGSRTDLTRYDRLREMLDAGASLLELAEKDFHSYLRFGRGLQSYLAMRESMPRDQPRERTRLTIVLGDPGMGKNTWVRNNFNGCHWVASNAKWFDGYIPSMHDTIVLDEFLGQVPITTMNTWCGIDPTRVETKGGSHGFFAKELVIISNLTPIHWWSNTRVPLKTFFRRIDCVVTFREKWEPTIQRNMRTESDRSEPCEEIMREIHIRWIPADEIN